MSGFRHRIIGMGKLQRINDFRMRSKEQLRRKILRVHRSKEPSPGKDKAGFY